MEGIGPSTATKFKQYFCEVSMSILELNHEELIWSWITLENKRKWVEIILPMSVFEISGVAYHDATTLYSSHSWFSPNSIFFFFFFRASTYFLYRVLTYSTHFYDFALYHLSKTWIGFWCRQRLNLKFFIEPLKTLLVLRTHTFIYIFHSFFFLNFFFFE